MVRKSIETETVGKRELLVLGEKTFKIRVPASAKLTFGPFSPPTDKSTYRGDEAKRGTLRVYEGTNVVAVFSGVQGYRDTSLEYSEQIAKEEGATIWKSDQNGYEREEKVKRSTDWLDPVKQIPSGND